MESAAAEVMQGMEERRRRHRTAVDSAQTNWESTRVPHQHNPGLGRHAGPGAHRETLSTSGGGWGAMQSNQAGYIQKKFEGLGHSHRHAPLPWSGLLKVRLNRVA
ncbi:unnamed protein product [Pleuronectes platessa]|uniref:Uncharacterized protein n=1 Tax=Pleuronectes platessa TaxID=8262 RepID=A0A9N7TJI9_PLEPL|nr:unnamed protein product [Pleuronectes platessa]